MPDVVDRMGFVVQDSLISSRQLSQRLRYVAAVIHDGSDSLPGPMLQLFLTADVVVKQQISNAPEVEGFSVPAAPRLEAAHRRLQPSERLVVLLD